MIFISKILKFNIVFLFFHLLKIKSVQKNYIIILGI